MSSFEARSATRARSSTPLISPRSENPWRPSFDQGSDQTKHLHEFTYDSESSDRNRLVILHQHRQPPTGPPPPRSPQPQQRNQSPAFPSNWQQPGVSLGQQRQNYFDPNSDKNNYLSHHHHRHHVRRSKQSSANRHDNDDDDDDDYDDVESNIGSSSVKSSANSSRQAENYLKAPLADSRSLPQSRQHQVELAKLIKHIDSDGEWIPPTSSNETSFTQPQQQIHRNQAAQIKAPSSSSSSRASTRDYEADRSSANVVGNYGNIHKASLGSFTNRSRVKQQSSSAATTATTAAEGPRNPNSPSKSPKIQRELSPAARAKRERDFEDSVHRNTPRFSQPVNSPPPSYEQSSKRRIHLLSSSPQSPPQHSPASITSRTNRRPVIVINSRNNNNSSSINNNNNIKFSSNSRFVADERQPASFKKETPRHDFYLAAADQRNPLGPREAELRSQILQQEETAAEFLFRKIFGLLGFYWDEERKMKLEERNRMLDRVRKDPQYQRTKRAKTKNAAQHSKLRRVHLLHHHHHQLMNDSASTSSSSSSETATGDGAKSHKNVHDDDDPSDEFYFQNLIKKLKKRTREISERRKQRIAAAQGDGGGDEGQDRQGSNIRSSSPTDDNDDEHFDRDDDDEASDETGASNENDALDDTSSPLPIIFQKNQDLANLLLQAQKQRERAQTQSNENSLLQHWLSLASRDRYNPRIPIELSLTELGESDMRRNIERVEVLMRSKLNGMTLETLNDDWNHEKSKHWQHASLYEHAKKFLDKLLHDHDQMRGRQLKETFNNVAHLKEKLSHGHAATLTSVDPSASVPAQGNQEDYYFKPLSLRVSQKRQITAAPAAPQPAHEEQHEHETKRESDNNEQSGERQHAHPVFPRAIQQQHTISRKIPPPPLQSDAELGDGAQVDYKNQREQTQQQILLFSDSGVPPPSIHEQNINNNNNNKLLNLNPEQFCPECRATCAFRKQKFCQDCGATLFDDSRELSAAADSSNSRESPPPRGPTDYGHDHRQEIETVEVNHLQAPHTLQYQQKRKIPITSPPEITPRNNGDGDDKSMAQVESLVPPEKNVAATSTKNDFLVDNSQQQQQHSRRPTPPSMRHDNPPQEFPQAMLQRRPASPIPTQFSSTTSVSASPKKYTSNRNNRDEGGRGGTTATGNSTVPLRFQPLVIARAPVDE